MKIDAVQRRHVVAAGLSLSAAGACQALGANTAISAAPGAAGAKGLNGNELDQLTERQLAATVQKFRDMGVQWVRLELDWSRIQPDGPQDFRIAPFAAAIKALLDASIKTLALVSYCPRWANQGQSKFHPPNDPAEFGRFAGQMVRYFGNAGPAAWEVWNEPNSGLFWRPRANPVAYAALLRAASKALRAAGSTSPVVTGGLAQTSDDATSMRASRFASELYKAGAQPWFDALGNHPYTSPRLPADWGPNNWKLMNEGEGNLREIMRTHLDSHKTIWVTELGAPTLGIDSFGTVVSERRQTEILQSSYHLAAGSTWLGPVFWYNFRDFCGPDPSRSSECFYGLLRHDGSEKPAARAYAALRQQ